jgi:hypothetical protein
MTTRPIATVILTAALGLLLVLFASPVRVLADSPYDSGESFAAFAEKLRENALERLEPQVHVPTSATKQGRYPWRTGIVTTTFWVGETPTANNPTSNEKSAWDQDWVNSYGGFDDPKEENRRGYLPKKFIPRQNPFYIALPYNDTTLGTTKPEARKVIPWFDREFEREGKSVCKGRWIAIRYGDRVAYAQWEDVGPFRTDHWQYVFGKERPSPNINKGAGLDVSPAVRDYLGMKWSDVTDWRFVELNEVPPGPWRLYGDNNPFVQRRGDGAERLVEND